MLHGIVHVSCLVTLLIYKVLKRLLKLVTKAKHLVTLLIYKVLKHGGEHKDPF